MKKLILTLSLLLPAAILSAADNSTLALIPLPQTVDRLDGEFALTPLTRIYTDRASEKTGEFLAQKLRAATGYPLEVHWRAFSSQPPADAIYLTTKSADASLGAEGYDLTVSAGSIVIRAPKQAGVFYGGQTLRQLLPPDIFSTNVVAKAEWPVPCVHIRDWPRFPWRGILLDVSRHFFSKADVETLLDEMALYKLNTFHWHLVDDDGWRIEIKKYPKLTEVGAWRMKPQLKRMISKDVTAHPAWMAPSADKFDSSGRYGGYYTQDDVREVIAYAAARHIMIVPEIEMPGHSSAALAAYPELSCFGGPYHTDRDLNHHDGIYDPANEQTFAFLDGVLKEVFHLFPSPYIHIGGDEVRKDYWMHSPDCQALMKREGLKDGNELQSWFIKRMEKYVDAHGKKLIGWSEILQGGLAPSATVMDWIGGGFEAASQGHDVIMTPGDYCYFDHYQSTNHAIEPQAIGDYLPLQTVYSFEPIPARLPADMDHHILGAQGNVWTECIASEPHVEYMIFPRACALAEVTWSARDARNWTGFQQRLVTDEKRLDELNVNYRH